MAVDMFLKIDDVVGESADAKHKGEIDVLSWGWKLTQSGAAHMGGGAGSGKVDVQDLVVIKYVDRSTPVLWKFCASGKHFKRALLTLRKAGHNPLEYFKIALEDGIVAGVTTACNGRDERQVETLRLDFVRFKVDYTPQKNDGSGDAVLQVGWDIATNRQM